MATSLIEFFRIESAVRYGQQPDNPNVLSTYLAMSSRISSKQTNRLVKRAVHFRVAGTLLDTVCDTYVARHWRDLCLDNIYKPIFAAEQLAISEKEKHQVRRFQHELNTLGNYFL